VWLDDISHDRLRTGNLQELADQRHVVGVTSNPTIFAHAVDHGDAYDGQLADLKTRGVSVEEASRAITTYDIRWACDVLRPVYDTTAGLDGRVSIEVDPRVAKDTHKTIAEARNLWWMVDRPNLFIKIPATPEGLPAITQVTSEGISVNVTLIFSLQRYGEVIDAYLAGLEQAKAAGRDVSQIRSVASFFVSRMDAEVDSRLDKRGTPEATALRGKAAIANARLAYAVRAAVRRETLAGAAGQRGADPAAAVGLDVHEGPGIPRHHVRHRARRLRHGEDHAGGHHQSHGRPRRAARRHRARHLRRVTAGLRRPTEPRHQLRQRGAGPRR
jgi:transaldolase